MLEEHFAKRRRALILSVGYGQGHHAAARALKETLEERGSVARILDPCREGAPLAFFLTQRFYHLCVRRLPWLWGVTYSLASTSDWGRLVRTWGLRSCCSFLKRVIQAERPDVIYCTYPLFAYMLDWFAAQGWLRIPYVVVVTDAIEISRPWVRACPALLCFPDDLSRRMMLLRYGLQGRVRCLATGFPVCKRFRPSADRVPPTPQAMRVAMGTFAPRQDVLESVRLLLESAPGVCLTLLAAEQAAYYCRRVEERNWGGRVRVVGYASDMHRVLAESHLYIGKGGAATMFECYACHVPMVVNYALPGQESGNVEKLLRDGCGWQVESPRDLLQRVRSLLANDAAMWRACVERLRGCAGGNAARRVVEAAEELFSN